MAALLVGLVQLLHHVRGHDPRAVTGSTGSHYDGSSFSGEAQAVRVEHEHVWRQTVSFNPEPAGLGHYLIEVSRVGRPPSGRSCSDPAMLAKIRAIQAADWCTYSLPQSPCCPAGIRRALEPRGGATLMAAAGFACSPLSPRSAGATRIPRQTRGPTRPMSRSPATQHTASPRRPSYLLYSGQSIQRAIPRAYRVIFAVTEKHGRLVRISRSPAKPQRTVTWFPIPESPAPVGPVEML